MGANPKRKEARKRKFGQDSEYIHNDGNRLNLESSSASEPPMKKSKQASIPPTLSEKIPAARKDEASVGKVAVVDRSIDQEKEEIATTTKAQRFIVFIGLSTLFRNAWLGRLMALYLHQAIYLTLQRMSP